MLYKHQSANNLTVTGTVIEGALPLNTSHDDLRSQLSAALRAHHGVADTWSAESPYVRDVFPNHVVYSHKGHTMKAGYKAEHGEAGTAPKITLDKVHKKVHVAYMDNADQSKESLSVVIVPPAGSVVDEAAIEAIRGKESVCHTQKGTENVIESAMFEIPETFKESDKPMTIPVKVIGPGWGSMAYYSVEALKKAANDGIFKAGTHMMWNHQTSTEESERPEGDLHNLAAVLVENAKWQEKGVKGPGLYAKAKVFSDYAKAVSEKGPHIGVSINAAVKAHEGTAEGRKGRIADEFVYAYSTDFVTKAGAGGAPVVPVTESAIPAHNSTMEVHMEEKDVVELRQAITKLTEGQTTLLERLDKSDKAKEAANAEAARLKTISDAKDLVTAACQEAGLTVKPRIIAAACSEPVLKEGKIDIAWVDEVVADFAESFSGSGGSGVRGMGRNKEGAGTEDKMDEARAVDIMKRLGVKEAGVEYALKGGRD